jgi:hypothetical protein
MKKQKPQPENPHLRHLISAKYYPSGRGKRITIQEEYVDWKPKKPKTKPFTWFHAHTKDYLAVAIRQYPNSRPILFPERLHMNTKEIHELLKTALALYYYNIYTSTSSKKSILWLTKGLTKPRNNLIRLPPEIIQNARKLYKRWLKWKEKHAK